MIHTLARSAQSALLGATALAALGGCVTDGVVPNPPIEEVCESYCSERNARPGAYQILRTARVGAATVRSPAADIYLLDQDGFLVTPSNSTYEGSHAGEGLPPINKTAGLDPDCFAAAPYTPIPLSTIDLDADNTTITLVNLDRDGRLESRVLDANGGGQPFAEIEALLNQPPQPGSAPEYIQIQSALSDVDRPASAMLFNQNAIFRRRDLGAEGVPPGKTPFYKDLTQTKYSEKEGHAFFYVLLDPHLEFARDTAALVTYAPQSQNVLGTLYAPFVQYPVMPAEPDTTGRKLDVLVFHFIRDDSFAVSDRKECRYVYDKQVIARGQKPFENATPLLIDPEIKSEGVDPK